jgi:hypothetical protein
MKFMLWSIRVSIELHFPRLASKRTRCRLPSEATVVVSIVFNRVVKTVRYDSCARTRCLSYVLQGFG